MYDPLRDFLKEVPLQQQEVMLSFTQIERILGESLPQSAHKHRAWWSNEQHGQHTNAHAWMTAKWEVDAVDQKAKWVRFRRQR